MNVWEIAYGLIGALIVVTCLWIVLKGLRDL